MRTSHFRMASAKGWEELKLTKAYKALRESQKIAKDCCERVKINLRAYKMAESSAVYSKIDVTEGMLPPRQNPRKTTPNPSPASDFDPSLYTGED